MARVVRPESYARALIAALALCIALAPGYAQGGPASGSGTPMPSPSPLNPDRQTNPDSGSGPGSGTSAGAGGVSGGSSALNDSRQAAERKQFLNWFVSSQEGLRLAAHRADIEALAYASIAVGVPVDAYKLRIKEAAAKGVAPPVVLAALREDARLWDELGNALSDKGWPPAPKAADLYIAAATALRNGLALSVVLELFGWAAPARAQSERVGAVLKALTLIVAKLPMEERDAGRLALELAKARLAVGQFDELAALAGAAAGRSIAPGEFARVCVEVLRLSKPLEELARRLSL